MVCTGPAQDFHATAVLRCAGVGPQGRQAGRFECSREEQWEMSDLQTGSCWLVFLMTRSPLKPPAATRLSCTHSVLTTTRPNPGAKLRLDPPDRSIT